MTKMTNAAEPITFTDRWVALDEIAVHPQNVRQPDSYEREGLEMLKDNIAAFGMIQKPIVQQIDAKHFGAIAGGRRVTAMKELAAEGRISGKRVHCRVIGADVPYLVALSLAENVTQEKMHPLDELAAYARMIDAGMGLDDVARIFRVTLDTVKRRLRLGRVHPTIQEHFRKYGTVDALDAFARHPDQHVQLAVFEQLKAEDRLSTYTIRAAFDRSTIQRGQPIGAYVYARYVAEGGPVVPALFEAETVLSDGVLVEAIALKMMLELAEETRTAQGLAWARASMSPYLPTVGDFERIETEPRLLSDAEKARRAEIIDRRDEIADHIETIQILAEDGNIEENSTLDISELEAEDAKLAAELEALEAETFPANLAATAGVIVHWCGSPRIVAGLIERRPEAEATSDAVDEIDPDEGRADERPIPVEIEPTPEVLALNPRINDDLSAERRFALAKAIVGAPDLAYDAAHFALSYVALSRFHGLNGIRLRGEGHYAFHSKSTLHAEETAEAERLAGALALEWLDERDFFSSFAAFRALPPDRRAATLAYALSQLVDAPVATLGWNGNFATVLGTLAIGDIRKVWKPHISFWERLTKAQILLVMRDLGLDHLARAMDGAKKSDLVSYINSLFTGDIDHLSDAQREAVAAWVPPGFALPVAPAVAEPVPLLLLAAAE
jgi:ParB family chromosome partitioning protein